MNLQSAGLLILAIRTVPLGLAGLEGPECIAIAMIDVDRGDEVRVGLLGKSAL